MLHGARSSPMGAPQESTAAPRRAGQPHGRAPEIHGAPWRATQPHGRTPEIHGRSMAHGPAPLRRLPKQAASRQQLPQRPALPAAAAPETGGVWTAAPAASDASGGGGSRNRRRLDGGFRSVRRFRRRRLPKQAAPLQRLPQRRRLDGGSCTGAGTPGTCIRRPARVSMPYSCTYPFHAQTAAPEYPLSGENPRSIPGSTMKSQIRESRAQSPQLPASDAATQSARQRRQSPCNKGTRQHGVASSARVTHGRQSGFVRHAGPHTHDMHAAWTRCMSTPAARAVCFPAAPEHAASMLYQCGCRVPGIHPSRSPETPQDAQSANSRRNPRKRLLTRQRHRPPASAVSPLYSARIDSPLSSGTRTDDHAFPARFRSTPSMPCPDTRGAPMSAPRIHGRSTTNPEKSPICKWQAEFPAKKMMHRGLHRLRKFPTVQPLARKTALLPPGSPTEPNSS